MLACAPAWCMRSQRHVHALTQRQVRSAVPAPAAKPRLLLLLAVVQLLLLLEAPLLPSHAARRSRVVAAAAAAKAVGASAAAELPSWWHAAAGSIARGLWCAELRVVRGACGCRVWCVRGGEGAVRGR